MKNDDVRNIETLIAHFIVDPQDALTDARGNNTGSAYNSHNGAFPTTSTGTVPIPGLYSQGSTMSPIK